MFIVNSVLSPTTTFVILCVTEMLCYNLQTEKVFKVVEFPAALGK